MCSKNAKTLCLILPANECIHHSDNTKTSIFAKIYDVSTLDKIAAITRYFYTSSLKPPLPEQITKKR